MKTRFAQSRDILKKSLKIFSDNDPLRLAGATAFFTTFALPAVLFLILLLLRLVFPEDESEEQLFAKLARLVGKGAASHLFNVLTKFDNIATDPLATVAGFLFLLFVATTLFKVIKNSLNDLWDIKVMEKMSVRLVLTTRLRELSIVLSAGLLLMLTLYVEGMQMAAVETLATEKAFFGTTVGDIIGFLIAVAVVTCWFGIIFCFLPDARVPVITGLAGALLTSILFNIGKLVLRHLLLYSNLYEIFGRSAAVVLLLLFVFYSSFIFYFGAAYTKALAMSKHKEVRPLSHAGHYVVKASKNE